MPNFLNPGDQFPRLTLKLTGGGTFSLPDDLETPMSIVIRERPKVFGLSRQYHITHIAPQHHHNITTA